MGYLFCFVEYTWFFEHKVCMTLDIKEEELNKWINYVHKWCGTGKPA